MDIFNRKRIEQLEIKLHQTERERDKYLRETIELKSKLEEISKLIDTIPKDCTLGPWCKACEFSRQFHISSYCGYGNFGTETITICNKGESCKNFVYKEIEE